MEDKDANIKRTGLWKQIGRIAIVISTIASIGALIGVWLQIRSEMPRVDVQILTVGQLTPPEDVPGLVSRFSYNDSTITNLWKLRLRYLNSGDETLIGEGPQKNILGDGITVSFQPRFRILDHRPDTINPLGEVSQLGDRQLLFEFAQWREEESFIHTVFVTSDSTAKGAPVPYVPKREIIDGDVVVKDLTILGLLEPQPLIDYLPDTISIIGRVLGLILGPGVGLLAVYTLLILFPYRGIRWFIWKSKYIKEFARFVEALDEKNVYFSKEHMIENPWLLQSELWGDFPKPKCPVRHPEWESWHNALGLTALGILVLLGSAALVTSIIKI